MLIKAWQWLIQKHMLESGNAIQNLNGIDWTYAATYCNATLPGTKIKAIAKDVPVNEGLLEVTI